MGPELGIPLVVVELACAYMFGRMAWKTRKERKLMEQQTEGKAPSGLWKNQDGTRESKYLVKRRDGTVPEWPHFVLGAKDPAAPAALRAYADEAERLGMNAQYVTDVRNLSWEFDAYRASQGAGDPDRARHRKDDPVTIAEMRGERGA